MKLKPGAKVEFQIFTDKILKGIITERCDVHEAFYYIEDLKSGGEYYIHYNRIKLINSLKFKLK